MLLSDRDIEKALADGFLAVTPYDPGLLQPASLDLRLDRQYRKPKFTVRHIDVAYIPEGHTDLVTVDDGGEIELGPGEFILGSTAEAIELSAFYAGRVEGKSSLARLGCAVHVTGGFIDPCFRGQVTLEIANLAPWAITLRAGMRIAQLAVHRLSSAPATGYDKKGHYVDQQGPTESRFKL